MDKCSNAVKNILDACLQGHF